ncbi:hypothetical protein VWN94_10225, partial [Campylobacter coli]|nr:hypothetical protein [Campylobacter coli]
EGAKELIEDFKKQKIQSIILSGDNEKSVQSVANLLGIADFKACEIYKDKIFNAPIGKIVKKEKNFFIVSTKDGALKITKFKGEV